MKNQKKPQLSYNFEIVSTKNTETWGSSKWYKVCQLKNEHNYIKSKLEERSS